LVEQPFLIFIPLGNPAQPNLSSFDRR
jgi:hypothetical protein